MRRQDAFDSLDFLWIKECRSFHQKHIISDCMRHMGYQFCNADTDLWTKAVVRLDDGSNYYTFCLCWWLLVCIQHHDAVLAYQRFGQVFPNETWAKLTKCFLCYCSGCFVLPFLTLLSSLFGLSKGKATIENYCVWCWTLGHEDWSGRFERIVLQVLHDGWCFGWTAKNPAADLVMIMVPSGLNGQYLVNQVVHTSWLMWSWRWWILIQFPCSAKGGSCSLTGQYGNPGQWQWQIQLVDIWCDSTSTSV